ncbi:MAG: hypothetical protein IPM56_01045 [Ignavibacteriales bacterium]|nr:MAG: hypothetical protein IPM56_01045 [Ignavibacteriales bacterium]
MAIENFPEEYSKYLNETNEHLNSECLSNFLNAKELFSDDEIIFFESHLNSCSICREALVSLSIEDNQVEPYSNKTPYPIQKSESWIARNFKLLKYAAAIVFIIFIFILMFYDPDAGKNNLQTNLPEIPDTVDFVIQSPRDPAQDKNLPDEKSLIARQDVTEQFHQNILLENFISQSRTENRNIRILSPILDEVVSTNISFKWRMNSHAGNLRFVIVDNKNNTQYSTMVSGSGLTIEKRFKEGLYYWKLYANETLEAAGRFIVQK